MNGGGDRLAGQQHNDILSVQPDSDEEKQRVVDELKRRGNAAFKVRSLREAETLYSRALELQPKTAALWGNRSMARLGMGKAKEAASDAREAIKVDAAWPKGYYRLGQAQARLKEFADAVESFEKVLELEPKNKPAKAEIEKCKKGQLEYEKEVAAAEAAEEAEKAKPRKVVSRKVVDVKGSVEKKVNGESKAVEQSGDVDLSMRGYRTLADGRKTTFFNMEQSEEDKKLLEESGKTQPLKLDEKEDVQIKQPGQAGSAWNQGNTFEEKDLNKWALDKLHSLLEGIMVEASSSITLNVENVAEIEGDASIAVTRGKQRHIFDFNFSVEWTAEFDDIENNNIKGSLFYPEFNGDEAASGGEFECELRWPSSNRSQVKPHEQSILTGINKLKAKIQTSLERWVKEFNAVC